MFRTCSLVSSLPDGTLLFGIHPGILWAVVVRGEFLHVGERSLNAELTGTVDTGCDAIFQGFGSVFAAPGIGRAYPE